ncbi:hypothetical protein CYMTET_25012 [Cymbomonas tetramitiformis]|uniref:Uncharacterized protein n=1 Tax=Cymbomonas tetramitiformis TaxID=36881 RepID=A0AAE0FUP7_9CHLO|nr:hypothetical protein CYMTET_25012 [Cymbomonas tetramitiformis]
MPAYHMFLRVVFCLLLAVVGADTEAPRRSLYSVRRPRHNHTAGGRGHGLGHAPRGREPPPLLDEAAPNPNLAPPHEDSQPGSPQSEAQIGSPQDSQPDSSPGENQESNAGLPTPAQVSTPTTSPAPEPVASVQLDLASDDPGNSRAILDLKGPFILETGGIGAKIGNTGESELHWELKEQPPWAVQTAGSWEGTLSKGEYADLGFGLNPTLQPPPEGEHQGKLIITSDGGQGQVPITLALLRGTTSDGAVDPNAEESPELAAPLPSEAAAPVEAPVESAAEPLAGVSPAASPEATGQATAPEQLLEAVVPVAAPEESLAVPEGVPGADEITSTGAPALETSSPAAAPAVDSPAVAPIAGVPSSDAGSLPAAAPGPESVTAPGPLTSQQEGDEFEKELDAVAQAPAQAPAQADEEKSAEAPGPLTSQAEDDALEQEWDAEEAQAPAQTPAQAPAQAPLTPQTEGDELEKELEEEEALAPAQAPVSSAVLPGTIDGSKVHSGTPPLDSVPEAPLEAPAAAVSGPPSHVASPESQAQAPTVARGAARGGPPGSRAASFYLRCWGPHSPASLGHEGPPKQSKKAPPGLSKAPQGQPLEDETADLPAASPAEGTTAAPGPVSSAAEGKVATPGPESSPVGEKEAAPPASATEGESPTTEEQKGSVWLVVLAISAIGIFALYYYMKGSAPQEESPSGETELAAQEKEPLHPTTRADSWQEETWGNDDDADGWGDEEEGGMDGWGLDKPKATVKAAAVPAPKRGFGAAKASNPRKSSRPSSPVEPVAPVMSEAGFDIEEDDDAAWDDDGWGAPEPAKPATKLSPRPPAKKAVAAEPMPVSSKFAVAAEGEWNDEDSGWNDDGWSDDDNAGASGAASVKNVGGDDGGEGWDDEDGWDDDGWGA